MFDRYSDEVVKEHPELKVLRFLFDSERVFKTDTPEGLGITNNATMEVLSEQVGSFLSESISNSFDALDKIR